MAILLVSGTQQAYEAQCWRAEFCNHAALAAGCLAVQLLQRVCFSWGKFIRCAPRTQALLGRRLGAGLCAAFCLPVIPRLTYFDVLVHA